MDKTRNAFCPNTDCKDFGLQNQGNIAIRGKYGKDKTKELLYPGISPVNNFRLILKGYFNEDISLLEDKSYFSKWSTPYDFIDVTSRVR